MQSYYDIAMLVMLHDVLPYAAVIHNAGALSVCERANVDERDSNKL